MNKEHLNILQIFPYQMYLQKSNQIRSILLKNILNKSNAIIIEAILKS